MPWSRPTQSCSVRRVRAVASANCGLCSDIHLLRALAKHKRIVYDARVIRNFTDKDAERLFTTGTARRLPPDIWRRAMMRLYQLDAASSVGYLREPPSNRLEPLSGGRAGQWSIRINSRWRLCFRFEAGDAFDVEIVDYH